MVKSAMRHRKAWVATVTNEDGSFVLTLWEPRLGDKEIADRLRLLHAMMCQGVGEQMARFRKKGPLGPVEVLRSSQTHVSILTTYGSVQAQHSTILEHSGEEGPQWVRFKPTPYSRAVWGRPGTLPTFEPVDPPEQRLDVLDLSPSRLIRLRNA